MVGPDFQTPEAPVADQYLQRDSRSIEEREADTRNWWQVFNDPVLDKLIQTAYQENLSLRIAGLRVLEARAQLGIAAGNLYPQVQELNGDITWVRPAQPAPNSSFTSASLGFDAGWEIDFWGKFRRGIESADANLIANIAGYDDVLVTLTAEVARTYILIRTLEERIRIAKANVDLQTRSLRMVEVRFQVGTVTELDVQQAKTLLFSTEASVYQLQLSLNQARHALAILLGLPPEDLSGILGEPAGLPDIPSQVAVGIPADLLRRRPDIKQAELQAAAQGARIGVAKANLLPSFSLFGTLGWSATDVANASLSDPYFGGSIGPAFRWPIFNYGRLRNQVRVEDARFEQSLTNYQNVVLNAAREVEDALTGFVQSGMQAASLDKSVTAAKRSTELSMLQYKEGRADYQRVLDSTRALALQWDQYIQTQGNIAFNLIATYKALGGGWQMRLGNEFVPVAVQDDMRQRTNWGDLLGITSDEPLKAPEREDLWRWPDW